MTDADFLLSVLSDGEPHSLNEILSRSFRERGCGLTVHSRAADLRKRGHVITNTHRAFSKSDSVYQLASLRKEPPSEVPRPGGSSRSESAASPARRDTRHTINALAPLSPAVSGATLTEAAPEPIPGQLTITEAA